MIRGRGESKIKRIKKSRFPRQAHAIKSEKKVSGCHDSRLHRVLEKSNSLSVATAAAATTDTVVRTRTSYKSFHLLSYHRHATTAMKRLRNNNTTINSTVVT